MTALVGCSGMQMRQAEETAASKRVSDLDPLGSANSSAAEGYYLFIDASGTSKKVTTLNLLKALEGARTGYEIHGDNLPSDNKKVVSLIPFASTEEVSVENCAGGVFFRIPATLNGWVLNAVAAANFTAGTDATGGTQTTDIQIRNRTTGQDLLTEKIHIEETETDSSTATTQPTINTSYYNAVTGQQWCADVDNITATLAPYGLLVEMTFKKP